ncbi:hypothetical protein Tco_0696575 [Tanacetum coccineum]
MVSSVVSGGDGGAGFCGGGAGGDKSRAIIPGDNAGRHGAITKILEGLFSKYKKLSRATCRSGKNCLMDDVGYVIVAQLDVRKDEVDIVMLSFDVHGAEAGDVVLRESYKPKTRERERVRLLVGSPGASTTLIYSPGSSSTPIYSLRSSSTPIYSRGSSTPPRYSSGTSRNAECSNCKHLLDKMTVLEATVDMYMHPEQHTVNSTTLFHEVYNNMGKLDLE